MIQILRFLLFFCESLFTEFAFRFVDSSVCTDRQDSGWVLLESSDLQLYFSVERADLLLEARSKHDPRAKNWYSFDLIRKLLTGEPKTTGVLDQQNAEFLRGNIPQIVGLFKEDQIKTTLCELDKLREERTRRL